MYTDSFALVSFVIEFGYYMIFNGVTKNLSKTIVTKSKKCIVEWHILNHNKILLFGYQITFGFILYFILGEKSITQQILFSISMSLLLIIVGDLKTFAPLTLILILCPLSQFNPLHTLYNSYLYYGLMNFVNSKKFDKIIYTMKYQLRYYKAQNMKITSIVSEYDLDNLKAINKDNMIMNKNIEDEVNQTLLCSKCSCNLNESKNDLIIGSMVTDKSCQAEIDNNDQGTNDIKEQGTNDIKEIDNNDIKEIDNKEINNDNKIQDVMDEKQLDTVEYTGDSDNEWILLDETKIVKFNNLVVVDNHY